MHVHDVNRCNYIVPKPKIPVFKFNEEISVNIINATKTSERLHFPYSEFPHVIGPLVVMVSTYTASIRYVSLKECAAPEEWTYCSLIVLDSLSRAHDSTQFMRTLWYTNYIISITIKYLRTAGRFSGKRY